MKIWNTIVGLSVLATLGSGRAQAGTIIVDDNGGAGVDFTDIQAAIHSATAGDLILVGPGYYSGFNLSLALTILGPADGGEARVLGGVQVSGIPGPQRAVLSGLHLRTIRLWNNPGHVVLDSLLIQNGFDLTDSVRVEHCADVRLYECTVLGKVDHPHGWNAVSALDSRLEIIHSELQGGAGFELDCEGSSPGGDALNAQGDSLIAIFESSLFGGAGGDDDDECQWWNADPGDGGHGLHVTGNTTVVLGGSALDRFEGGRAGIHEGTSGQQGVAGHGVVVGSGSLVRHSGVTIDSQSINGGVLTQALPADPYFRRLGTLQAGRQQTFWIHGTPGDAVTLYLGRKPTITVDPLQVMDDLVSHQRAWSLGPIPPSGAKKFVFTIPTTFPAGFSFFAQAASTSPSGERTTTNSIPLVLRHL